jgi:hypothetical protein
MKEGEFKMHKTLIKYVRDRKRQPVGVITAFVENGDICYGWSLLNRKAGDRWNRDIGLNLALARAVPLPEIALKALNHEVPQSVSKDLTSMVYRAKSYFHQV